MFLEQGRSEGTSSVVFKVLIISCEIDFINLFIFNYLMANINLFNFNCLTSIFCFLKTISFANRRTQLNCLWMRVQKNDGLLSSRHY